MTAHEPTRSVERAPRRSPLYEGKKSGHCVRDNGDPCWCGDVHYYAVDLATILSPACPRGYTQQQVEQITAELAAAAQSSPPDEGSRRG